MSTANNAVLALTDIHCVVAQVTQSVAAQSRNNVTLQRFRWATLLLVTKQHQW